jgi:hypothetical protein
LIPKIQFVWTSHGPDLTAIRELTEISPPLVLELVEWHEPYPAARNYLGHANLFPHFVNASGILRDLGKKGADILYIICALLWFVDENRGYVFRSATEEELRKEIESDRGVEMLERLLNEDLPYLARIFGEDRIEPLVKTVKELRDAPLFNSMYMDVAEVKSEILRKIGRPSEYYFNILMLVISRYLARTTKLKRGYKIISSPHFSQRFVARRCKRMWMQGLRPRTP